jgi:hypothetical protein
MPVSSSGPKGTRRRRVHQDTSRAANRVSERTCSAAGHIVGTYNDANGSHGFLDSGGLFSSVPFTGFLDTFATGVNDSGQIVGFTVPEGG